MCKTAKKRFSISKNHVKTYAVSETTQSVRRVQFGTSAQYRDYSVSYSITISIQTDNSEQMIENLSVEPERSCEVTTVADDFLRFFEMLVEKNVKTHF